MQITKTTNAYAALREVITTLEWYMLPTALHASRDMFIQGIALRGEVKPAEVQSRLFNADGTPYDPDADPADGATVPDGSPSGLINLMRLEGDVLRNGGLCAMGSMDMKEILMAYADKGVKAHIIIINSGGGSAQATYDFIDMIDYAHSKGQPVIAYVRGCAASAAYFLAMLCDKVLTFSEHDILGSIGAMVALFTQEPGTTNQYTMETYREVYADKSPMKNHAYREAEKGNMQPYKEMANRSCEAFHAAVRKYRPAVKQEQMTGEIWDAIEVLGTLCDEAGVPISRAFELANELAENYQIAARKAGTKWK